MATDIDDSATEDIAPDFTNHLKPNYVSGEARVRVMPIIHDPGAVDPSPIFSDPLHVCGHLWRLKIYPNGTKTGLHTCMSIFMELLEAAPAST